MRQAERTRPSRPVNIEFALTAVENSVIRWLEKGDIAVQYQVYRDLLGSDRRELQDRIAREGWGLRFLRAGHPGEHWGRGFYQPKWTSTHYTLLDLKNLGMPPGIPQIDEALSLILERNRGSDGGINPAVTLDASDVCVSGMFLNYASYFRADSAELNSIVDFLLAQHMGDGGFNCESNQRGATHSSLHSTVSVSEGILEYTRNGYRYRVIELLKAEAQSREFILQHRLFRSDRSGSVIDPKMLRLPYPSRWHYDILRALDYFQLARVSYDSRMQDALDVLLRKRRKDGRWPLQARHPGQVHFEMEQPGQPSQWNTLRALRVLRWAACGTGETQGEPTAGQ